MLLSGINQSTVKVTLRNPMDKTDFLDYYIIPNDTQLAKDWILALKTVLSSKLSLEKSYCFLGWPESPRILEYLCDELNSAVETINIFNETKIWQEHGLAPYIIEDWFHPNTVRFPALYSVHKFFVDPIGDGIGLNVKHEMMNRLHNHFERLQGTVDNLSLYYKHADYNTKYAIRQLNTLCHELENLILSQRKQAAVPDWVRPSQITTFLSVTRHLLSEEHRQGFVTNGYDREFGRVYMHWTQIGKTLFEVFRDEHAPKLDATICEAITHLQYYSGEFDIEWGRDVCRRNQYFWHEDEQEKFKQWLIDNNLNPLDPALSLGYLPIGRVDLERSFGTDDIPTIWNMMSRHLDIYRIEVDGISNTFDYCWADSDYKQQQIDKMRLGYDYSSRG